MRKNNGRRRNRGHNRRNFSNLNKNTVIESFGPISQVRGNVQQLNEKYNSLGNDAASNDDKVLSESYYQFAEHYHRLLKEIEIAYENKNSELNGLKSEDTEVTSSQIDTLDTEKKLSRKDRSIKAKIKENEVKNNHSSKTDAK